MSASSHSLSPLGDSLGSSAPLEEGQQLSGSLGSEAGLGDSQELTPEQLQQASTADEAGASHAGAQVSE